MIAAFRVTRDPVAAIAAKYLDPRRVNAADRILEDSFPEQRAFVEDAHRYITAVCSRRAGKTVGCAAKLLRAACTKPGSASLYLTLSRLNAKRIVWRTLLDLNARHRLGGEANEAELFLRFPNRSYIYLSGVNDRTAIEKYRGPSLAQAVIDEAQALPGYIANLVDEVLAPALMDHQGSIAVIGTPAPVPTGYFHDCAHSDRWAHHAWTVFNNPHIPEPRAYLAAECARRGITESDPIIRREFFGEWVIDSRSLVSAYSANRNAFDKLPQSRSWHHVIGVDLGMDDADAIAVLAWSDDHPNVWLVEEWAGRRQHITDLATRLKSLEAQYQPMAIVVDTGGLGKKIADEISYRTGLALEPAEKERKLEHIELMNDALRTARLFARKEGLFAHDSMLIEWDRTNPEKPKISDRFHSDIFDAVLYAYRRSLHWTHEPKPRPETEQERMDAEQVAIWERQRVERNLYGEDQGWSSENWEELR